MENIRRTRYEEENCEEDFFFFLSGSLKIMVKDAQTRDLQSHTNFKCFQLELPAESAQGDQEES